MKTALCASAAFALLALPAQAAQFQFWHALGGAGGEALAAQCERFNAAQAEHKIGCVFQGTYDDLFQKAIAAYRANQHPALVQFFDAGTLDLLLSDAVVPVTQVAADAGLAVDWDDYIAGARSYYTAAAGNLFGQPYNSSTLVFYTNDDKLAAAGITTAPATWEDVAAAAEKLAAAGEACPFTIDLNPWRLLEQFSAVHGAPIATKGNGFDGLDAEYVFNQGPNVKFITDLAAWHEAGLVKLAEETTAGNFAAAFNAGECAMMINSTGGFTDTAKALDGVAKFSVHLLPVYEGTTRHNTFVGGAALYAMKGFDADIYAGVAAYLDFVRQPEEQLKLVAGSGYLPVTETAVQAIVDGGLADQPDRAVVAQLGVESLSYPGSENTRGVRLGFYVQFRNIYTEEVTQVFSGQKSAQEALDAAKTRGDELLRRFEATYAGVAMP